MGPTASLRAGALLAGLAVGLGAFAAHGLKQHLDPAALQTFETGVRYQMYHALALCLCGFAGRNGRATSNAAIAFAAGIALFCGALYGLALGGPRWLGPVTPFGGVAFLVGWLLLAIAAGPRVGRTPH